MSATSASSFFLPSFNPKTLSLHTPNPSSLSLFSTLKFHAKPISVAFSIDGFQVPSSGFRRNVAVSSEFDVLSEEEEGPSFSPDLKLFVGNLPFNVDSAQLAGLFESAGNVEMVEVIYDKVTGRSRGFGFVTMSSAEEAQAAAQQFNGYELEGRSLRVSSGPPPKRREDSSFRGPRNGASFDNGKRLYVGNLPYGVDDLALETLFSDMGKVSEAKVVYDRESGRSRGFGFVTYNSAEEANNAIESLNGTDMNGRPLRVTFAEAKPRRY